MTPVRLGLSTTTCLILCASAMGQSFGDWNRKINDFSMTASATVPGTCDVSVDWQLEVLTAGFIPGDLTTEIELRINGTAVASLVQSASDIGAPTGGGDPGLCPAAICSGSCGVVVLGEVSAPMTCTERLAVCRCQSPPLTHTFTGVSFAPGDEIMVLLRPAPGALPDPNPDDDSAMITFASWNRRMTPMHIEPVAGNNFDITASWVVDLEDASEFDQHIGVEMDLVINGTTVSTQSTEDCLIWDVVNGTCDTAPDGASCGSAVLSGSTTTPTCDGDNCSAGPLSLTFPAVPLAPGDEIMVLLRPAPGALPEPDTSDDATVLTFGSWNRRVRSITPQPTSGAPESFFDIWVGCTSDFTGSPDLPADLSGELELRINGVPTATQVHEDCILWDIMNSGGGNGACAASAEHCGDLVVDGQTEQAEIDPITGTCSRSPTLTVFPGVELQPGDEIMVLLRPAPGALPDADEDDDIGILIFGSWNRRLVSVDVVNSPSGGPGTYDVTAEVVLEMTSGASNVLLSLGVDTEPYADDPCCQEACCCPACSCTAEGCGGGSDEAGEFWFIGLDPGEFSLACDAGCDSTCGQGCDLDNAFQMICDPDDCECRSEPLFLEWEAIPADPDDGLTVKLIPVPGALPELPGFPDDDEETVPVPPPSCADLSDCADLDDDGIRDNGCLWWECLDSECVSTPITFADMGGQFGACPPDGTADNNDRNIAINCFANVDADGNPGAFPCEPHPNYPGTAYNVDPVGAFGNCNPDGVCDGNDGFAALNAFSGNTTCSCAMSPEPGAPADPVIVDRTTVRLVPERTAIRPGESVDVHAFITTGVADLRGYQLHVGTGGGRTGGLRLVDLGLTLKDARTIRRDPRESRLTGRPVFADQATWQAFNADTAQLLVGLDSPGVQAEPGYLGTFRYRASEDASGSFVIELLHDDSDPLQRTFLFPTPAHSKIEVRSKPVVVSIE